VATRKYRQVSGTVSEAVNAGYSALSWLAEEARDIVDNAPEGINQTARIHAFESTMYTLESLDEPDVPSAVADLLASWCEVQPRGARKPLSRSDRCSNAIVALAAAKSVAEEWLADHEPHESDDEEEQEERDDVEMLVNVLSDAISEAEGVEFPGMFG